MRLLIITLAVLLSVTVAQAQPFDNLRASPFDVAQGTQLTMEKTQEAFEFGEQAAITTLRALRAAINHRFPDDPTSYLQAVVTMFAQLDAYRRHILDDKAADGTFHRLSDYFTDELRQGKAILDRERSN
jgi:hypothetical protein